MSEFKYACPVCGQHIQCDSTQSGTTMECPTCFQKIIVPQAPATDDPKLILKGTKASERPIPAVVANAEALPAPATEKSPVGTALVFFAVFCIAVLLLFVFHGNIFKPTSGPVNQGPSVSNGKQTPSPAPSKPIAGLASVVFAKGNSITLGAGMVEAEVKDPAQASFLAAFKADLARPLAFEGPAGLSTFSGGRVIPGSAGAIQWHQSFPGGLVLDVTLQGLVPDHKYILSINGDPQRAGNGNLVDVYRSPRGSIVRYFDFSRITTDATGNYHATFGIMLPADRYDVSFYVKEPSDFSIVLCHDYFQFTVE